MLPSLTQFLVATERLIAVAGIISLAVLLIYSNKLEKNKFDRLLSFEIIIFGVLSVIFSLVMVSIFIIPGLFHVQYMFRAAYIILAIMWMVFGIGVFKKSNGARIGLIIVSAISIIDHIQYPSHIISAIRNHQSIALSTLIAHLLFFISLILFFSRSEVKQRFEKTQSNWFFRF